MRTRARKPGGRQGAPAEAWPRPMEQAEGLRHSTAPNGTRRRNLNETAACTCASGADRSGHANARPGGRPAMTALNGNAIASAPSPAAGVAATDAAHALLDICGLLTVQAGMQPDEQEASQFEAALLGVARTQIGAELLRNIDLCDVPPQRRPVRVFHRNDAAADAASADERHTANGACIINFRAVPAGNDEIAAEQRQDQILDLFLDLAGLLAEYQGRQHELTDFGFGRYSLLTLQEQMGYRTEPWQRALEAYAGDVTIPGNRHDAIRTAVKWIEENNAEGPLDLSSMNLWMCPPLAGMGVTQLSLAGNRFRSLPPAHLIPDCEVLDISGNTLLELPTEPYPALRTLLVGGDGLDADAFRAALGSGVEVIDAGPDTRDALYGFDSQAPQRLQDAIRKFLGEEANEAWIEGQRADPFGASELVKLLDRAWNLPASRANDAVRDNLRNVLRKMQQPGNAGLMMNCLQIARESTAACDDLVLLTLNDLHVAALNADAEAGAYDDRILELMHLGEDMFNQDAVTRYVIKMLPELERRERERLRQNNWPESDAHVDQVEQILDMQNGLRHAVFLPSGEVDMQWASLSLITWSDIEGARAFVEAERNNGGYLAYLADWAPLQSVMKRVAPSLVADARKIEEHFHTYRGPIYKWLDRLLQTEGQLFRRSSPLGLAVFEMPRPFWTANERRIARRLADAGLRRDDFDAVREASRAVASEVKGLIWCATMRRFLSRHKLNLHRAIAQAHEPKWFKTVTANALSSR
ncbi:hypothetical protein CAL14_01220 [Bordetella genomosp. 9]|nr:hypothetical protein CAL14_01220 [Bordetella genomosp. 9]